MILWELFISFMQIGLVSFGGGYAALAPIYYKFSDVTIIQNILDGLRPTVVALIASAGLTILITAFFGEGAIAFSQFDVSNGFLFVIAIIGLRKFKLDPTKIIILTGLLGIGALVLEKL